MEKFSNKTMIFLFLFLSIAMGLKTKPKTKIGFYSETCPEAESIIRKTVEKHVKLNARIAPGLLRLIFHDCFVRGCDASILLEGEHSEKTAPGSLGLQGFEVIDDAKSQLEDVCPNTVSCADILALASRDAVILTNGPSWEVPTGRLDGKKSIASETFKMPSFLDSVKIQKKKFAKKGLNIRDLVTLVGGHTIGTTACLLFNYRLYNYSFTGKPDPSLDPRIVPLLQHLCPEIKGVGVGFDRFLLDKRRAALDLGTANRFDLNFFINLKNGRGLLESDQKLWTDDSTKTYVKQFLSGVRGMKRLNFNAEFGKSMVKMTNVGLKKRKEGEIRKICSKIN